MTLPLKAALPLGALALTPLAAPLLAASHPLPALLVHDVFSALCHQDPARSFYLNGAPVAVCVRCLGIYIGVPLAALLPVRASVAVRWIWLTLIMNLLDVATATLHWHGNLPLPRFLLGLLLGLAAGALLFLPRKASTG